MKTLTSIGKFFLCITAALFFLAIPSVFAQDTTGGGTPGESGLFDKLIENLEIILPVLVMIYEVIVRYVPTAKNWSVISKIFAFLNALMPNKTKDPIAPTHEDKKAIEKAEVAGKIEVK